MKPNAYRIFTVLLLATFSVWVGCSHNTTPELSNLQRELNEKDNEIRQLASENTNNENQISLLAKENSEKDRQLKEFETKLDQQVKNASMQDQSSPEASLYPPQANPGECFARVLVPPTYATASERVLTRSASERLEIIPARYESVEEKVLAEEAQVVWKKGRGPVEKLDNTTGEIMCLVEVPASYKTVKKTVMVNAPGTRKIEIPAEYKTVKKRVVLEPAQERTISIPAEYEMVKVRKMTAPPQEQRIPVAEEYQTVTKTVKTNDGRMEWRRIMCETNVTTDVVSRIQTTLQQAGYDPGPIDGILGRQTVAAVKSYQRDNRLAEGGLTYETVKKLDVSM